MQLTFSRSFDPIVPLDISITRVAITKSEDAAVVVVEDDAGTSTGKGGKVTEMGRKSLVAYGLYHGNIFYSPQQAADTGFDGADLALFWDALERMWDFDRSASRGMMACQVKASIREGVAAARSIDDYDVKINLDDLPEGVTATVLAQ